MEQPKVLYLCDKRACEICRPDCTHTHDVTHAKNFKLMNHSFLEGREENAVVIIQAKSLLTNQAMLRIRGEIEEMLKKGYILCDSSFNIISDSPRNLTFTLSIKP